MLTPNEQRMHQNYFPNDSGLQLQRPFPSTKSYQTPGNGIMSNTANPFMADAAANNVPPFKGGLLLDDSNSVSTTNPHYVYLK